MRPQKLRKYGVRAASLDAKMVPKVVRGATLGPQMATNMHNWGTQISPQALPRWPLSYTFVVVSIFFLIVGAPSLDFGGQNGLIRVVFQHLHAVGAYIARGLRNTAWAHEF